ncbi:MAG: ester cyclase [Actinomycetota bacterium]|nr:ester cyclase [Actinomycetota bacterium]
MSREQNLQAQEHLGALINAGAFDRLGEVFAVDAVDHDPAPGQGPGAEGFVQFYTELGTGFPDAQLESQSLVADDEQVAIAYTLTGTHQGEFQGIAPTGRRIEARGVQIGRFADGKIVERWGSSDELGILQQLGASVSR